MTLAAIGRRAGVSKATVSKVLNDRHGVSAETRRRVRALLAAYGYSLPGAAEVSQIRGSLIDVLVVGHERPWAAPLLSHFGQAARLRGHDVVSMPTPPVVPDEALTRILARGSRGVVVMFTELSAAQRARLAAYGVPAVMVGSATTEDPAAGSIEIDYRGGVRAATEHLLERGHRSIALTLGGRDSEFSRQMLRGYVDAVRAAGLRSDPSLVRWGEPDAISGATHARALLDLDEPPTAVIAAADLMAVGIYETLQARNLQIGRDLAVVAFGDRPEASWLRPRLSTIEISINQLTDAVLDQLADRRSMQPVRIGGTLVVRESSNARPTMAVIHRDSLDCGQTDNLVHRGGHR